MNKDSPFREVLVDPQEDPTNFIEVLHHNILQITGKSFSYSFLAYFNNLFQVAFNMGYEFAQKMERSNNGENK